MGGLRLAVVGMVLAVAGACGQSGEQAVRASDSPAYQAPVEAPTTSGPTPSAPTDAVAATRSALEAWGRFTASGDLAVMAPYFHPRGPQYLRFQDDAAGIASQRRPPTSFGVTSLVSGPGSEQQGTVSGIIVVSRGGEEDTRVEWDFTLFREPNEGWKVWTVTDRSTGTSPVPT